jgi:O-antigen/teichoic acid export membrane protein
VSTRVVFRNAGLLAIAQAIGAPLALLVNAVTARKLGAEDFGLLYQAWTFSSFALLFVEWGTSSVLAARVAAQRDLAGRFLGSALAFRLAGAIGAALLVCAVSFAVGYGHRFVALLALAMMAATCGTIVGACQDTLRGFERAELAAASHVVWQLLSVAVVVPVLLLGGGITGLLVAQVCCALAGCAVVVAMLPRLKVPRLEVSTHVMKELFRGGHPFLVFSIVLVLQPLIDAAILAKIVPPPAGDLGWYAAARKLIGVLVYPASALIIALYPTLCRLRIESMEAYRKTAADAMYALAVLVVPLTMGCIFFPELGVAIFGQSGYGPAADNLGMLAPYVALVYLSMPVGSCLASSGRQTAWTTLQFGCVIVSVILDPPLIRWFLQHFGNGSLGVCAAAVISEAVMLAGGLLLLPQGVLARVPWLRMAAVVLSGIGMAATAYWSTGLNVVLRVIAAGVAYILCLQLSGGFNFLQTRALLREIRGH